MILTRDKLESIVDYKIERVDVPEWNCQVCIRPMSAKHRELYQKSQMEKYDVKDGKIVGIKGVGLTELVLSYCICDESGQLLFNDDSGRELLSQKDGQVLEDLCGKCLIVSKLREEDLDEAKKPLETEGNSSGGTTSQESVTLP